MKKMRRLISVLLALVLVVSALPSFANEVAAAEDYRAWAQADSRWGSMSLGNSGGTVGGYGCLVTSVAKLLVQAGLRDPSSFNPGTLVTWLNNNGGFTANGSLIFGAVSTYTGNAFVNQGYVIGYNNGGGYSSSASNADLLSLVKQGYHMTLDVGGHYVAVDEARSLSTGTIYIMDTGLNMVNTDITLASRYSVFYAAHAYKGGNAASLKVWWGDYAVKQWVGDTNAVLANVVYLNIDNSAISEVGICLYDYSGNQLTGKREGVAYSGRNQLEMWYDVNGELGYTLLPGTPYKYKFVARVNGKDYYSDLYSITTGGTHTHKYDSGTVTKSPTCTATGTRTYTCTTCGGKKTESIAAKGHSWKNATCTAAKTCTVCGTTSGSALGHSFSYKLTKNPTTDATGTLTGTCSKCSGTTTVTLPKLTTTDYTYAVTKAATCTASGTGRYTWKTTSYGSWYFDVSIAAKGHSWTGATCTSPQTCSSCGTTSGSALGHNYSYKVTKNPTTSAPGTLTGTCSKCSGTMTVALPKLNTTDYTYAVTKAATCTASGTGRYTWKTTSYGSWYFDASISATGHSWTGATCTSPQTCSSCGTTSGSALGHEFAGGTCTRCGNWCIEYEITDGQVTITDCDTSATGELVIPATIEGYPVTAIGNSAFSGCWGLTAIVIPESVTSIGNSAFSECLELKELNIPNSVTDIGRNAFAGTGLTSITIPDGMTSIGERALAECYKLEEVHIPDSVTSIGDYAFRCCYKLTEIVIPDSVTSIGANAFWWCHALTKVNIPDGVDSIADEMFEECYNLTEITIPASVTSIGKYAFSGCSALTDVYYDGTQAQWDAITIGDANEDLTSATLHCKDDAPACLVYEIAGGKVTITDCDASATGELVIPAEIKGYPVTTIGKQAFKDCIGLTAIVIPNSVTIIKESAFVGCTSLTAMTIPDSVTSTGGDLFANCTALRSVELSDGITVISSYYFRGCTSLETVKLGSRVTSIGQYAFYNCSALNKIELPESLLSIGVRAFHNCEALTEIIIPDSVTQIKDYAFNGCTGLKSVKLPASLTQINLRAFFDCRKLTEITIPDGVTAIGEYAFYGCFSLQSVHIPDGVTTIGDKAFYGCKGVTELKLPAGVTKIGNYAFYQCTKLEDVYYAGTQQQWNTISMGSNNEPLLNATLHCKEILQQQGNTLVLMENWTTDELTLSTKQVLDLNGHVLTVESLASFGQIIDSVGGGGLIVTNLAIVDNDWLPIKDSTGCYRFYEYKVESLGSKKTANGAVFGFTLDFVDATPYSTLLESNDVAVKVTLSWGDNSRTVAFNKTLLQKYAQLQSKYPQLRPFMKLTVTGIEYLAAGTVMTVTPTVTAIGGKIQMIGESMQYIA